MAKKRRNSLQLEQPQLLSVADIGVEPPDPNELEVEIECPSCRNSIMTLYSVSDGYYACNDCNFCLYT